VRTSQLTKGRWRLIDREKIFDKWHFHLLRLWKRLPSLPISSPQGAGFIERWRKERAGWLVHPGFCGRKLIRLRYWAGTQSVTQYLKSKGSDRRCWKPVAFMPCHTGSHASTSQKQCQYSALNCHVHIGRPWRQLKWKPFVHLRHSAALR